MRAARNRVRAEGRMGPGAGARPGPLPLRAPIVTVDAQNCDLWVAPSLREVEMTGRQGAARPRRVRALAGLLGCAFVLSACADLGASAGTTAPGAPAVADAGEPAAVDPTPAGACAQGAPAREEPTDADPVGEPSPDLIAWQEDAVALVEPLSTLAGDRLGGVWLAWEPEPALVIALTPGSEIAALHDAATASDVRVDIRYTAPVSRAELVAAADRLSARLSGMPGLAGFAVDEQNGRLVFHVASGEDGGDATCTRLVELLADEDVPYGFAVFEGPAEATVRTTVPVVEAYAAVGPTLELVPASCNGDPQVTALEETSDAVRVEVTATVPAPGWGGEDCLDAFTIVLEAPLGERTLVDLSTGHVVEVHPARW